MVSVLSVRFVKKKGFCFFEGEKQLDKVPFSAVSINRGGKVDAIKKLNLSGCYSCIDLRNCGSSISLDSVCVDTVIASEELWICNSNVKVLTTIPRSNRCENRYLVNKDSLIGSVYLKSRWILVDVGIKYFTPITNLYIYGGSNVNSSKILAKNIYIDTNLVKDGKNVSRFSRYSRKRLLLIVPQTLVNLCGQVLVANNENFYLSISKEHYSSADKINCEQCGKVNTIFLLEYNMMWSKRNNYSILNTPHGFICRNRGCFNGSHGVGFFNPLTEKDKILFSYNKIRNTKNFFKNLYCKDLRAICRYLAQSSYGKKEQLIDRINLCLSNIMSIGNVSINSKEGKCLIYIYNIIKYF